MNYVYPIGKDDEGNLFQWVDDWDVKDCSKCCFWDERCRYFELNKGKKGECFIPGYFKRIHGKD